MVRGWRPPPSTRSDGEGTAATTAGDGGLMLRCGVGAEDYSCWRQASETVEQRQQGGLTCSCPKCERPRNKGKGA